MKIIVTVVFVLAVVIVTILAGSFAATEYVLQEKQRVLSERTLWDKVTHPLEGDRGYIKRVAPGLANSLDVMDEVWK